MFLGSPKLDEERVGQISSLLACLPACLRSCWMLSGTPTSDQAGKQASKQAGRHASQRVCLLVGSKASERPSNERLCVAWQVVDFKNKRIFHLVLPCPRWSWRRGDRGEISFGVRFLSGPRPSHLNAKTSPAARRGVPAAAAAAATAEGGPAEAAA